MYQTTQQIIGSFRTEDNKMMDAQYFVVDSDEKAYWYQQQVFYREGIIQKLNEENVYKVSFEDDEIIIIYYENYLVFINNDKAVNYIRVNLVPEFTGVENK